MQVPATLLWSLAAALLLPVAAAAAQGDRPPNFVVIYADDLGYGDLGCFGHPTIRTPHLDRMAAEGMRFTQFYSASSVCTPSRAALMTGRLPIRSGMCSDTRRVLFPNSGGGLPAEEITLAEALHERGYATGCFGKWHLGHLPRFLPTNNGFDTYFGIPYSNDMDRVATKGPKGRAAFWAPQSEFWNVPLLRDTREIERPADQTTITRRYTEHAVEFIKQHQDEPFFVYLPHSMVHVPLFRSQQFEGISSRGLYGDCVQEVDWSVGEVLTALKDVGLEKQTLVFFSSDNGPWLTCNEQGGSAGLLRDGKGCTFEGGMREPTIVWWPSRVPAGAVSQELGSTMDIFATCVNLAGGKLPSDRVMDGIDLSPVLLEGRPFLRKSVLYYRGTHLMAVRLGAFKAHFITQPAYGPGAGQRTEHDPPLLYNLEHDPGEQYDIADAHPDVLKAIAALVAEHRENLDVPPSQLEIPLAGGESP